MLNTVRADGEVLLCAGAVRSPQILQLSGIGPEKVTAAQGITVRHVSPEVGENLQDHVQMRTIVEMSYAWASLNKHVLNPLKLAEMAL